MFRFINLRSFFHVFNEEKKQMLRDELPFKCKFILFYVCQMQWHNILGSNYEMKETQ